jgi:hypothetical protein
MTEHDLKTYIRMNGLGHMASIVKSQGNILLRQTGSGDVSRIFDELGLNVERVAEYTYQVLERPFEQRLSQTDRGAYLEWRKSRGRYMSALLEVLELDPEGAHQARLSIGHADSAWEELAALRDRAAVIPDTGRGERWRTGQTAVVQRHRAMMRSSRAAFDTLVAIYAASKPGTPLRDRLVDIRGGNPTWPRRASMLCELQRKGKLSKPLEYRSFE